LTFYHRPLPQVENVVACMGTSLCLGHLYALRVVLPEDGTVVLAFDHDKAGVLSAEKACTGLLLGLDAQPKLAGLTVKIAQLPEGDPAKDPADFVVVSALAAVSHTHIPAGAYPHDG
jgi:DNA primase